MWEKGVFGGLVGCGFVSLVSGMLYIDGVATGFPIITEISIIRGGSFFDDPRFFSEMILVHSSWFPNRIM